MRYYLLLIISAGLLSCKDYRDVADAIYYNARVWTGDEAQPFCSSIAVKGNIVLHTGEDSTQHQGPYTLMINLEGKMVVPGFIDNHTHFLMGGYTLTSVNLRSAQTRNEFIQLLKDYCTQYADDRWIMGGNWDHEAWGGQLPERSWIDSVCGNHPVFLSRYDGHMAFANTQALQRAGINAQTPQPAGGTIQKNAAGEPTGVLKDEAMELVNRVIPAPTEGELNAYFERAQQHALEHGVTQVHDMGSYGGWSDLMTYQRYHRRNKQQLRVYAFMPLATWPRLDSFCRANGRGDDLLRWGGLKGFVDGSLGATTAWFYKPYLDAPGSTGLTITDTLLLRNQVLNADKAGLQVAVHAIGDRANDYMLDVYQTAVRQNGTRDRRFRVEHAQHLTSDAILTFAQQEVIPSMQPYHAIDDGKWAYKRLDDQRLKGTYAFNRLLQSGARLTFGSDWMVAPLDPLLGIYAAVTRRTMDDKHPQGWYPEEKITVDQALRCYTVNNAYAGFQESKLGRIKSGMLADFAVLSDNLLTMDPNQLNTVQVMRTIVDGKEVYTRGKQP